MAEPELPAGCGYRASVSRSRVIIRPTTSAPNCTEVTMGLGNAVFTFDPQNPPDTLKRVLTEDSNGAYSPQWRMGETRHTKSFTSVEMVQETFTDANGRVTNVSLPKLAGFDVESAYGNYEAFGFMDYKFTPKDRIDW